MNEQNKYSLTSLIPLVLMYTMVILCTLIKSKFFPDPKHSMFFEYHNLMMDFMGSMFIVTALFKIIRLKSFAEAYCMYDIIAKHFRSYAFMYPFIQLALGICCLTRYQHMLVSSTIVILMLVGIVGVINILSLSEEGKPNTSKTLFQIPLEYVTLLENLTMGGLAAIMILTNSMLISSGSLT